MLTLLKRILYLVLVIVLLAALAGGLFLLAWWADWPITTVVVVPVAIIAAILLLLGIKRLWQWKNRSVYVRTVLREDPSRQDGGASIQGTAMQRAWARGMQFFGSPAVAGARLGDRTPGHAPDDALYRHPWVVVLGDEKSRAHDLASCQARSPESPDPASPLHWHFLPDLVLLEPAPATLASSEAGSNWESLLAELSKARSREPVNAFVVAVAAESLIADQAGTEGATAKFESIRAQALKLRARIDDILTILPASVPLRIVVTGIEILPGMARLASRLGRQTAHHWLGSEFAGSPDPVQGGVIDTPAGIAVQHALDEAEERLHRILLEEAGLGNVPDGDDLATPAQFASLRAGLTLFAETILRQGHGNNSPFVRGIHFMAFAGNISNPAAAEDVFAGEIFRRLPDDRKLAVGISRPSPRDLPLAMAYAGVCLLLFALCACFASNILHSRNVLVSQQKFVAPQDTPAALTEMVEASARLRQLMAAEKTWWLPSLGLNLMPAEIEKRRNAFVEAMRERHLPAFLAECRSSGPDAGTGFPYAALQHLLWMQEVADKGEKDSIPFPIEENPPAAQQQSTYWNPAFGRLYLDFLDLSAKTDRDNFRNRLDVAIRGIVGQDEEKIFRHVLNLVNANTPQWDVPVSRFWSNVPRGSNDFIAIPPAFTATGYARISENMERLAANLGHSFRESAYWKAYLGEYAKAWEDFVEKSDKAWEDQDRLDTLLQMAVQPGSKEDPYHRLMQTIVTEMKPLRKENASPEWLNDLCLLRALWQVNDLASKPQGGILGEKKVPGMATVLWNAATKLDQEDLDILRTRLADSHELSPLVEAVKAIGSYQGALQELYQTARDREGSLELARIEYGGKEFGDPAATAGAKARKNLENLATILGFASHRGTARVKRDGSRSGQLWDASHARMVVSGPMRFLQYMAICNAAVVVQRQWETDVMPQAALISYDAGPDPLFGESGLIRKFLSERIKPFVVHEVGDYKPRSANNIPFPFTPDFLKFLQEGQVAQSHPRKESYEVPVRTSTASVNPEALERLQYYEFKLSCAEAVQTVRNSNYPLQGKFDYSEKNCKGVSLEISFPSLTLNHNYESFPDFLKDFSHGERDFGPDDFPDAKEKMEGLQIRQMTIRALPQNSAEILEAFSDELVMPSRITGVW